MTRWGVAHVCNTPQQPGKPNTDFLSSPLSHFSFLYNPSVFIAFFHWLFSSLLFVLYHFLYYLSQIPKLWHFKFSTIPSLIIYFIFLLTLFACITLSNAHTYTHFFCRGRRDANKNETWGLCRRPPADWGTPWEWWSAGSLSLPCRWTRCSGLAAPPSLHLALPSLFSCCHALECISSTHTPAAEHL